MVAETDEAYDQVELLDRLALDGAVPADNIDILARMLHVWRHRPPAACARRSTGSWPSSAPSGAVRAWLTTLATIRVVSLSLERTEVEIAEEVLAAVQAFVTGRRCAGLHRRHRRI